MRRPLIVLLALTAATVAVALTLDPAPEPGPLASAAVSPAQHRPQALAGPETGTQPASWPVYDIDTAVLDPIRVEYRATVLRAVVADEWGAAGWGEAVAAQLAAEEATRAALAAAARPAPRPASISSVPAGSTVGDCTGFAIPAYIIQRESGGNPSAYNPSGAYGCAQTLLSHYSSGSCRGLDPYTIAGQRECVNILSNGGTNLAPWAETR